MFKYLGSYLFRHSINITAKEQVRFRRTSVRKVTQRKQRTVNPGVNRQLDIFNEKQQSELGTLDLEELESDFMNLETSHKDHVEQIRALKEKENYLIVRQKYFKVKLPNFLTYSDKEQIRHLHNTDPDEWTIEKLSEGFPALPDVIKKIIKSSWVVNGQSKIKNHDMAVEKNWEQFKKGNLDLPVELMEHLKKFSNRKLNFDRTDFANQSKQVIQRVEGEFSEIITSYERLKNKDQQELIGPKVVNVIEDKSRKPQKKEMYLMEEPSQFKDNKIVTLKGLKTKLEEKLHTGNEICEEDRLILKEMKADLVEVEEPKESPIINISNVIKTSYMSTTVKNVKDYKHLEYPEKIMIPKNKFKEGYTYQLNDCFYDSHGYFLYRVPGMDK